MVFEWPAEAPFEFYLAALFDAATPAGEAVSSAEAFFRLSRRRSEFVVFDATRRIPFFPRCCGGGGGGFSSGAGQQPPA